MTRFPRQKPAVLRTWLGLGSGLGFGLGLDGLGELLLLLVVVVGEAAQQELDAPSRDELARVGGVGLD